jgi:acetyl esterase/lipase
MVGLSSTVAIIGACVAAAVLAPRHSASSPRRPSFWLGHLVNELPVPVGAYLVGLTLLSIGGGSVEGVPGWSVVAAAVVVLAGLVVIVVRGFRARPALRRAFADELPAAAAELSGASRWRSVLFPLPVRPRSVRRDRGVRYGWADRRQVLDVYRPRREVEAAPVLVHLHGGAFTSGHRGRESRPLLHRLAASGWVCVTADYRLVPDARYPDPLVDAKQVVAWVKERAADLGADPGRVFLAGCSAGGHLASVAALTPDQRWLQPGFEHADTSVAGVISLYGYYGALDSRPGIDPRPVAHVRADAPPFLLAHGERDTLSVVGDARGFARELGRVSEAPVVFAELPGGQHAFDLVHSLRSDAVVDAVVAFTDAVIARSGDGDA